MRYEDSDEGKPTPVGEVQRAVEALRGFLELARPPMAVDQPGWRYVPDAYRVLGELVDLIGLLPAVLAQVESAVRHELELNLIRIDPGTTYDGRPEAAVEEMARGIAHARRAAEEALRGTAAASSALTWAAFGGRQIDLIDGTPVATVWTHPYPAGERQRNGMVGTSYSAGCECEWPYRGPFAVDDVSSVDRQTIDEADADACAHEAATGHRYDPPDEIVDREWEQRG